MGITGAIFYVSGALVVAVVALVAGWPGASTDAAAVIGAAAAAAGVVVFVLRHRMPPWLYHPMNVAGTVMVTILVVAARPGVGAACCALLYVYVPLDSFFFFPLAEAVWYQLFGVACIALAVATGHVGAAFGVSLVVVDVVVAFVVTWLVRAAAQARRDQLTGLPNRTGMTQALQEAIERAQAVGEPLALGYLNLDMFGAVNADIGPGAGDRLLRQVAGVLARSAPPGALVARSGGDSFVVAVPGLDAARAADAVEELRARISDVSACSAGVSDLAPRDTAWMLTTRARGALFEAKSAGRARTVVHVSHHAVVAELAAGIAAGQIRVLFQPVVALPGGEPVGAEALARWAHPERGIVGPDEFIPLAEEGGLIVDIGRVVLRRAVEAAVHWPAGTTVNVNASGREIERPQYAAEVAEALATSGLAPERLVIEVTESSVGADSTEGLATLERLRALGVRIALDDFGTGYSSLSRLGRLPIDIIKVDRSFVAEIGPDVTAAPLVVAVCALARATERVVVAEGVEHPHQVEVLVRAGCTEGQGFLFGRPGPPEVLSGHAGRVVGTTG